MSNAPNQQYSNQFAQKRSDDSSPAACDGDGRGELSQHGVGCNVGSSVTAGVVCEVVGVGSADGPIDTVGAVSEGDELGLADVSTDGAGEGTSDTAGPFAPMYEQPTTITTTAIVATNRARLTHVRRSGPLRRNESWQRG